MKYTIRILRKENAEAKSYWQTFTYSSENGNETIASVLRALNAAEELRDNEGNIASEIAWECSCLQKKCGACSMVINSRPRLACDAKLEEFRDSEITIEPLRKFPVVKDLIVDRSILYENLKQMQLWLEEDAELSDRDRDLAYQSSECIQCGLCLEVCPNFCIYGNFYGMATVPITTRLLTEMSIEDAKEVAKQYREHTFKGCGKSLACKKVCPKGIDTENLLVNANAIAVWKRKKRGK